MLEEKMPASIDDNTIITVSRKEKKQLANFLNRNLKSHRHLDWITPVEWIGTEPYLIHKSQDQYQSVLCATPENETSAWIRIFAAQKTKSVENEWRLLLTKAIEILRENQVKELAGLALHPWFTALLVQSGFKNHQNVIVLEWQGIFPSDEKINREIEIRNMRIEDLADVERVDRLAFPPLWHNSLRSLNKAIKQTGISTVALIDGEIVGYQISTSMTIYGHLARLAVHPAYQRQNIAFSLVYHLLKQFDDLGFWRITVNTQSNNQPSLGLYKQFNFTRTKEEIPVYELNLT